MKKTAKIANRIHEQQTRLHELWGLIKNSSAKDVMGGMRAKDVFFFMGNSTKISSAEAVKLIKDLNTVFDLRELAGMTNIPTGSLQLAMQLRRQLGIVQRRIVWMLWSLCFRPENLKDGLSILTWGKLSKRQQPENQAATG